MAEKSSATPDVVDKETKKIRRTQEEKFKGQLNENDTKCLLFLNNGDPDAAFKDFCDSSIKDLSQKIEGTVDGITVKRKQVLKALEEKCDTRYVNKQYACRRCDRVWWWWSPARKQVSKCRGCWVRYDSIPDDKMFGWAVYECECGNTFNGYGQMGKTKGKCYKRRGGCGQWLLPTKINPRNLHPRNVLKTVDEHGSARDSSEISTSKSDEPSVIYDRETREGNNQNSDGKEGASQAEGASAMHKAGAQAEQDWRRRKKHHEERDLYEDIGHRERTTYIGTKYTPRTIGYDVEKMPWPRGKQRKSSKKGPVESRELATGKKKVLYASKRHTSTGSTVADFVTQDDNMSVTSSYIAHLQAIAEISGESDSGSD